MNQDMIAGKWKEVKGKLKQKWGKLTDDEVSKMKGSSEELEGLLQKKYGYEKKECGDQINSFLKEHNWKNE